MDRFRACCLAVVASALIAASPARAQTVQETMSTAWETLWQQSGGPIAMRKWNGGLIRVRFTEEYDRSARAYALAQLRSVADVVGIPVTDDTDGPPNLELVIDEREAATPAAAPCNTLNRSRGSVIFHSTVRANPSSIYRCMLHESMHVLGFSGHPAGHSILTYFNRGKVLTPTDKLLLRTLYSDDVRPGMSPFQFIAIFGQRVEAAATGPNRAATHIAVTQFLERAMKDMQAFADGAAEPPPALLRAARFTTEGVTRGRIEAQYWVGDAYLNGYIVQRDTAKAIAWLSKAAAGSHVGARRVLERIQP